MRNTLLHDRDTNEVSTHFLMSTLFSCTFCKTPVRDWMKPMIYLSTSCSVRILSGLNQSKIWTVTIIHTDEDWQRILSLPMTWRQNYYRIKSTNYIRWILSFMDDRLSKWPLYDEEEVEVFVWWISTRRDTMYDALIVLDAQPLEVEWRPDREYLTFSFPRYWHQSSIVQVTRGSDDRQEDIISKMKTSSQRWSKMFQHTKNSSIIYGCNFTEEET